MAADATQLIKTFHPLRLHHVPGRLSSCLSRAGSAAAYNATQLIQSSYTPLRFLRACNSTTLLQSSWFCGHGPQNTGTHVSVVVVVVCGEFMDDEMADKQRVAEIESSPLSNNFDINIAYQ